MTQTVGRPRITTRTQGASKAVRTSSIFSLQLFISIFIILFSSPCINFDPLNTQAHQPCWNVVVAASPERSDEAAQRNEKTALATKNGNSLHQNLTLTQVLSTAGKRALNGGLSGAVAGVVQVVALMWLRTITNYEYRYGTSFRQALQTLLKEGGVRRLYKGLAFALIQAPAARFASVAANDGVKSLLGSFDHSCASLIR